MRCPECGSPSAIEYKPGHYICSHCDNGFKVNDPSRITVDVRPSFCACGNRVEFQCQLCASPLCHECDVIEWRKHRESSQIGDEQILAISGDNFGYREARDRSAERGVSDPCRARARARAGARGRQELWSVKFGKIVEGRADGLYLYPDDILPVISPGPGRLRHVCCACLENGVSAAVVGIASGKLCEHPGCGDAATTNCGCCQSAFCALHVRTKLPISTGYHFEGLALIASVQAQGGPRNYTLKNLGFCGICADERTEEARKRVATVASNHPVELDKNGNCYKARMRMLDAVEYEAALFGWLAERKRRDIIKQFSAAVEMMILEFETQPRVCRRAQYHEANHDRPGYVHYDLVDERDTRSLAAGQA